MLLRTAEPTLDDPQVFVLGGDVLLTVWDTDDSLSDTIDIAVDGKSIGRRRATLRLTTAARSVRTLVAFHAAGMPAGAAVTIKHGKRALRALPSDIHNVALLTTALSDSAQARLAGFVVGVCRGTFRLSETGEFAVFCQRLLQTCARGPVIQFRAEGHLAAGHVLYSAAAPADFGAVEAMFAGTDRRVTEFPFRPLAVSPDLGETRLALVAPRWATVRGLTNVMVGERGLATVELLPSGSLPNVASLAEQKKLTVGERHYVLRCLGAMGEAEAAAAARAMQILAPEPVRDLVNGKHPISAMLEFTASCGGAGIFAQGWIRDRNDLVQDAELVSPFGTQALRGHWHRLPRPDLQKTQGQAVAVDRSARPGFVALVPIHEPVPVLQHGLRLMTAGGAVSTASPLKVLSDMDARNAVLSAVHPNELKPNLLADVIAPAAAELHRRVMATQTAPEIIEIGEQRANPAVSFIIPLYRNLSFLRLQTSAFSVDPEIGRDVELIYVLDSPEQKGELEHLLRGLHVVTGLSFRLVVMGANFGYAAANNTGARAARGNTLMLMNSDVIPLGANWLRSLRTVLRFGTQGHPIGAVGPKLIFDDGSLQHAGLTFERDIDGRWYNTHFFKGYPRDWAAANVSRSVPGVTGACMLMPRAVYEEIGGFSEDYVVGDYEDSDLCLRLRSKGYDIRYEPRAELYHFERRSITLHTGYVNTAASSYNRALHASRWSDLMAEVTAGDDAANDKTPAEPEAVLEPVLSGGVR